MFWHVYIRRGTVYVPTVARAEAGYFLDVEPVEAVRLTDRAALEKAITGAIRRGNPEIPTPTRAAFPKPVVLRYAKARSWSNFEKDASVWNISERDGHFEIGPGRRSADGRGWEEDASQCEHLPAGTNAAEVAGRLAVLVRTANQS